MYSLLNHSSQHIGKIYLIQENVSKHGLDISKNDLLLSELRNKIIHFVPKHFLSLNCINEKLLPDIDYRHSIRYQYGWENSKRNYIFITHNDCYYNGDVVGRLLENIQDNIAAGEIGMCWNCPARHLDKCQRVFYYNYKPNLQELNEIYSRNDLKKRPYNIPKFGREFRIHPWPLPECRVNEWAALINLKKARRVTVPYGKAYPFGAYRIAGSNILDIGVGWFRDISNMGFKCAHVEIRDIFQHFVGHAAMRDEDVYIKKEEHALSLLKSEFNIIANCN